MQRLIVAAGGTGGHIFPALSFALEMRRLVHGPAIGWIGSRRSREQELCARYGIELRIVEVTGIPRKPSLRMISSPVRFARATLELRREFRAQPPVAVVAFGGYVCAPAMAAALLAGVPIYIQEQNTVPGLVNRLFASRARCCFLGFALSGKYRLRAKTLITGTPVRPVPDSPAYRYPEGFDPSATTVLICGGSQGALSMNRLLVNSARRLAARGVQVVWQTGNTGFTEIAQQLSSAPGVFLFETIDDLYPYYAASRLMIGRSGASTLSEAALFGLPVVTIPLPWAAENHQWINAATAQDQGWAIRIAQGETTERDVDSAVDRILCDGDTYARMRENALMHSPRHAAELMVLRIREDLQL